MKKSGIILALFYCMTLFSSCRGGPMEETLKKARADLEGIEKTTQGDEKKKALGGVLTSIVPLLDEKKYADPKDIKQKENLMYQASLLGARIAFSIGAEKSARELFMNAYLLRGASSLADLKKLLPAGADTAIFDEVRIPDYKIASEETSGNSYSAAVSVEEQYPMFLLQMICGDIIKKSRAKNPGLRDVQTVLQITDQTFATGHWTYEEDEIKVVLLAQQ